MHLLKNSINLSFIMKRIGEIIHLLFVITLGQCQLNINLDFFKENAKWSNMNLGDRHMVFSRNMYL